MKMMNLFFSSSLSEKSNNKQNSASIMNNKLCFEILMTWSIITSNVKQNIWLAALLRPICLDLNSNLLQALNSLKKAANALKVWRGVSFSIQKVTKLFLIFSLHPVQDIQ